MPSSTDTFGIPELLEMILKVASPKDLLIWQRVNKTWQAAIQRSARIQERLYLRAKPYTGGADQNRVVLNPFLDLFLLQNHYGCRFIAEDAFSGKASYLTASWRQLFVTSPAITTLRVFMTEGRAWEDVDYHWSVTRESGVTIGQLVNIKEEADSIPVEYDEESGEWRSLPMILFDSEAV